MIKKRLITGLATAGIIASAYIPAAFAETNITIQDNGAKSDNDVTVTNVNSSSIDQSSKTIAETGIDITQNTGNVKVSGNTGTGDIDVVTSDATSTVDVSVTGGNNEAAPKDCGCPDSATTVKVKDNGYKSDNTVVVTNSNSDELLQKSLTKASTGVLLKQKTGKVRVKKNTGAGSKTVTTGNTDSTVDVTVKGGSNTAN